MSLWMRLQRLEQRVGSLGGCPDCRDRRGRIVLLTAQQLPDGSVVAAEEPRPCARCGQVPEQIIEVVESVADERGHTSELGASA